MNDATGRVICLVDIFDWAKGGHFRTYFRVYSRLMLESGHQVIAICRAPEEITEWVKQNVAPEHAANFSAYLSHKPDRPRWLPKTLSKSATSWLRWRALNRDIRQAARRERKKIDGVFLIFFEDFVSRRARYPLWFFERTFPWPWAFLSISSRHHRRQESEPEVIARAKLWFHLANARNCHAWCILDEKFQGFLQGMFPKASIHLFADVTDESPPDKHYPLAQEALKRANGRGIVTLLGVLDRRKGLLTLMRAAKRRPDIFFLIAGMYSEATFSENERREISEFRKTQPANCLFWPEPVGTESQFNALVSISDILFLGYVGFKGSSNVMTKAAMFRKPVIVSTGGLCHERMERHHLGVAIAEESDAECSAAIDHLLSDAGRAEQRDHEGFAQSMSLATLKGQLDRVLCGFASRNGQ